MRFVLVVLIVVSFGLSGCATSLNSAQKDELKAYEVKGLAVKEKSPGTGAALGILPGGGSFYSRHYGIGVINLLLWPASILWDPISGYQGSKFINYYATKTDLEKKRSEEQKMLDDKLVLGQVSKEEFVSQKHEIERKYSPVQ